MQKAKQTPSKSIRRFYTSLSLISPSSSLSVKSTAILAASCSVISRYVLQLSAKKATIIMLPPKIAAKLHLHAKSGLTPHAEPGSEPNPESGPAAPASSNAE